MHPWVWDITPNKIDKGQFEPTKDTCTTHTLIQLIHFWLNETDDSKHKQVVQA